MSQPKFRRSLLTVAITSLLAGAPALAQEADNEAAQDRTLERIEVTARKTAENIQQVPVAVTSIGAMELEEKGISVLTEIQQFSPNTTLQNSRGTNSTLTAFIRGVGQQDPLWGYEPGVGIYIDDVYMARPQGAVLDLLNVERIEVLRGPQGTLYGKNTVGGAVKYITRRMTGDTELEIEGTVGSYSQRDIKVTGQLPVIDNVLYVGFGVGDLNRDGFGEYLESAIPGQDLENYNKDVLAARATIEFTPTTDLFFRFAWDKTDDESNSKGGYRLLPSLLTDAEVPDSVFDSYTSMPTWNKVELEGYSLTAEWNINSAMTLKYVGAARESYSPTNIDFDSTPLQIFDVPAIYDDEQSSHELQLTYLGNGYSVVGGLYSDESESCGRFDAILTVLGNSLGAPGLTREVSGCSDSKSLSAYVQGSFDITDKLSMTLGARQTEDEKEAYVTNGLIFDNIYPEDGWVDGFVRDEAAIAAATPMVLGSDSDGDGVLDAPKKADWSRFTPRVGFEYQYNNDVMFFTSYAEGFKSGTFNPRATTNEPAADPELVDSIELGMKSDWGNRLRANVTLFSLDFEDRQYISILPGDSAADLNQRLANIGKSSSKGVELELQYVASNNLTFDAAFGYIDSQFDEVIDTDPDTGETFNKADRFTVSNTPEVTANLGATYEVNLNSGSLVFNGNYYYRSEYDLFEESSLLTQDGYGIVNAGVVWYSNSGKWTVGLHGKNLTDEEYLVGGYQFVTPDPSDPSDVSLYQPGLGGDTTLTGYYGDPRTISLTVGYKF
ncbi:iron complex outermembrane recepter protein [Pseudidiomarina planktonica]|uniref:Iron complex outermembrane recepter protein n=1 Tax=Pseudidiomarina planktonica TaxID=1323738 RepID=A0A1Y6G254_9GAMM|nr:TonB-dependent receptor [Pseudidiomarina planktonica]RUO63366.1 ligand-gated channel protein [Pseudidiomarina planktonica]SMQ80408.1 iron complex outermembrane recepter protein [Pseudidiomarina planktonica]